MRRLPLLLAPLALVFLGARPACARQGELLAVEGDPVPEIGGDLVAFTYVAINDSGEWSAVCTTDADMFVNEVTLSASGADYLEGETVSAPAGATVADFGPLSVGPDGTRARLVSLFGTPGGIDDDRALYLDGLLLLRESDLSLSPDFSPGTVYREFRSARRISSNEIIVHAWVDDPQIASASDAALVRLVTNPTSGVLSETVLVVEGDAPSGLVLDDLGFFDHTTDANAAGQLLYLARIGGPSPTVGLFLDDALIARQGDVDPITGVTIQSLENRQVALGPAGDCVYSVELDADVLANTAILKNQDTLVAREGEPTPGVPGETLVAFGSGPLDVDTEGDVLWLGQSSGGAKGLFLDQALLVLSGRTVLDGQLVAELQDEGGRYALSPNGRFVLFTAWLADNREALFRLDLAEYFGAFCFGNGGVAPGCTPCPCGNATARERFAGCLNGSGGGARLTASGFASVTSDTLRLTVDGANPETFGVLVSGSARLPQDPTHPCFGLGSGLTSVQLDGLRCVGGALARHGARMTDADGSMGMGPTPGFGPPDGPAGGLVAGLGLQAGTTRHVQLFYREAPGAVCASGLNTTNGVTVTAAP